MTSPGAETTRRLAAGRGTIVGLDVARFLAGLNVVVYHYAFFSWHEPASATGVRAAIGTPVAYPALLPVSWWGWVGVEMFFVISGLVILLAAEQQSPADFLRKRVLRIAPALWFFATLSLAVTLVYSPADVGSVVPMYLRSLVLFPQGPWIDGVYWTLTVEAVFYALTCLLIALGWITRLQLLVFGGSMLVFGFYLSVLVARIWPELGFAGPVRAAADAYVSRVLLLTSGAYFLVGANLYLVGRDGWTLPGAAGLAASLAAGAIGLWVAAEHSAAVTIHARSPATPVLIWLAFVAGLWLSLVHHRRGGGGSPRARNLARTAGLATYPLYLFHNIAGAFVLGLLLAAGIGAYTALAVAIFLGLAVSVGFALWIEPVLRRGLARRLEFTATLPISRTKHWSRT